MTPAQKCSLKSSGLSPAPSQSGDCSHTQEKPNSLRNPAPAPQAPLLPPNKVAMATEHRRSPCLYLALVSGPPTPALLPINVNCQCIPGEDIACAHFDSSFLTKPLGTCRQLRGSLTQGQTFNTRAG